MDINTRTTEIIKIFKKLNEINLGIYGYPEFTLFRSICNDFIRKGVAISGNIPIKGTKRIIYYDFNKKKVNCLLKYDENV